MVNMGVWITWDMHQTRKEPPKRIETMMMNTNFPSWFNEWARTWLLFSMWNFDSWCTSSSLYEKQGLCAHLFTGPLRISKNLIFYVFYIRFSMKLFIRENMAFYINSERWNQGLFRSANDDIQLKPLHFIVLLSTIQLVQINSLRNQIGWSYLKQSVHLHTCRVFPLYWTETSPQLSA